MSASVCVFCSASDHVSPFFFSEIEILGRLLAEAGLEVWYGGASVGLMGRLADSVIEHGGVVKGIMPRAFEDKEIIHQGLAELIHVDTLVERKEMMMAKADAFLAFPGGVGTLDELMEVMAHRQLGLTQKPLIVMNILDFWRGFLDSLVEMQQQRMISMGLDDLFDVVEQPQEALTLLHKYGLVGSSPG
ncbi:MAG: TIGR00730 family Rossman fold protein [Bdellovibrionales bacterium]|nr:TIGR00730 family Rossman fold protein [Bdellovibrionales bacterium]